jgi:hypothetical protein
MTVRARATAGRGRASTTSIAFAARSASWRLSAEVLGLDNAGKQGKKRVKAERDSALIQTLESLLIGGPSFLISTRSSYCSSLSDKASHETQTGKHQAHCRRLGNWRGDSS